MEKPNYLSNLAMPMKRSPLWREGAETRRNRNSKISMGNGAEAPRMNGTNFTLDDAVYMLDLNRKKYYRRGDLSSPQGDQVFNF